MMFETSIDSPVIHKEIDDSPVAQQSLQVTLYFLVILPRHQHQQQAGPMITILQTEAFSGSHFSHSTCIIWKTPLVVSFSLHVPLRLHNRRNCCHGIKVVLGETSICTMGAAILIAILHVGGLLPFPGQLFSHPPLL